MITRQTQVCFLILFLLAVACAVASQEPPPQRTSPNKGAEQEGQRGGAKEQHYPATPTQPPITIIHPEKSAEELKQDAEQREKDRAIQKEISNTTRGLFWLTVVTVIVSAVGLWIGFTAAQAAQTSAETARDALVAVQRAFLIGNGQPTVKFIEWTDHEDVTDHSAIVTVTFVNNGSTPAIDVIGRIVVTKLATAPSNMDVFGPTTPYRGNIGYVGPKAFYYFERVKPEVELFGRRISNRPKGLPIIARRDPDGVFVYGWVAYRDIFYIPHALQYCFSVKRLAYDGDTPNIAIGWSEVSALCGTDETCPNYDAIVAQLPQTTRRLAPPR